CNLEITDSVGRQDAILQQVFPRIPLPSWQEVIPTEKNSSVLTCSDACDSCKVCVLGSCLAQTVDGRSATFLGCSAGEEGCRRCDAGNCTYYTSGQHGCSSGYECNGSGQCVEAVRDVCYGKSNNTQVTGCNGTCQACQNGTCGLANPNTDPGNKCINSQCYTGNCDSSGSCGYQTSAQNLYGYCGTTGCYTGNCIGGSNACGYYNEGQHNCGLGYTCNLSGACTEESSCASSVTFTYKGNFVTYGIVAHNNKCWMDRNLGALQVATAYNDANAYGDLFQWGRLDDSHQTRTSGITTSLSGSDSPGHSNFIYGMVSSPYDWRSPQNNNLWQGVSGTNNPCPSGWRLPTSAEWETERTSWSQQSYAGALASPLKLTAAGFRNSSNATTGGVGSSGSYWSSTVSGTSASYLYFVSNSANIRSNNRAYGFSVRCLKD
ncbi:MAG: hypothetical protein NTX52_05420, partial [Planctomycetota bacterium]|nr:hypothetical protein [Planctomycetota bacterium]